MLDFVRKTFEDEKKVFSRDATRSEFAHGRLCVVTYARTMGGNGKKYRKVLAESLDASERLDVWLAWSYTRDNNSKAVSNTTADMVWDWRHGKMNLVLYLMKQINVSMVGIREFVHPQLGHPKYLVPPPRNLYNAAGTQLAAYDESILVHVSELPYSAEKSGFQPLPKYEYKYSKGYCEARKALMEALGQVRFEMYVRVTRLVQNSATDMKGFLEDMKSVLKTPRELELHNRYVDTQVSEIGRLASKAKLTKMHIGTAQPPAKRQRIDEDCVVEKEVTPDEALEAKKKQAIDAGMYCELE
jgi:hypothetical protein